MSLVTGRQGYFGLAIEDTAGTPESTPDVFLPFTENSVELKHEKIVDISTRASRILDHNSINGKEWTEGDLAVYLDATNVGYLFKLALGNEVKTTVSASPAVDNHQFYVTASGNSPKTATTWDYRGSGPTVRQSSRMAIDSLELEVTNDGLATVTASFMGGESTSVTAPTLTTASGTVFTWADGCLKFGDTLAEARVATATSITNFKLTVANNLETLYRCGSRTPSEITMGDCEVTGEYTLFFEDDTHLDYYKNNSKKAMVLTLTGANLGGTSEQLEIAFDRISWEDKSIETGSDSLFAYTGNYRAINDTAGQILVVNLQNGKTSVY